MSGRRTEREAGSAAAILARRLDDFDDTTARLDRSLDFRPLPHRRPDSRRRVEDENPVHTDAHAVAAARDAARNAERGRSRERQRVSPSRGARICGGDCRERRGGDDLLCHGEAADKIGPRERTQRLNEITRDVGRCGQQIGRQR